MESAEQSPGAQLRVYERDSTYIIQYYNSARPFSFASIHTHTRNTQRETCFLRHARALHYIDCGARLRGLLKSTDFLFPPLVLGRRRNEEA